MFFFFFKSTGLSHGCSSSSLEHRRDRLYYQMSAIPAAAIGGAVGALVLIALSFFLIWFCIFRRKNASRTSDETGSSDPSTQGMFKSQLPSLSLSLSLYLLTFLGFEMVLLKEETLRLSCQ